MLFFDALIRMMGMMDFARAENENDTIPVSDGLSQSDGLISKSRHKSIPCGWPEPEDRAELLAEIENLHKMKRELLDELENDKEDARNERRSKIRAEEQSRRLRELLEECRQSRDTALKQNRELVSKLKQVQRATDCLDDDEAGRTMRKLYQDLQNWIRRHFKSASFETSAERVEANPSSRVVSYQQPDLAYLETTSEISLEISWQVFNSILTRVMVGWNEDFGQHLYQLDKHIYKTCKLPLILQVATQPDQARAVARLAALEIRHERRRSMACTWKD